MPPWDTKDGCKAPCTWPPLREIQSLRDCHFTLATSGLQPHPFWIDDHSKCQLDSVSTCINSVSTCFDFVESVCSASTSHRLHCSMASRSLDLGTCSTLPSIYNLKIHRRFIKHHQTTNVLAAALSCLINVSRIPLCWPSAKRIASEMTAAARIISFHRDCRG